MNSIEELKEAIASNKKMVWNDPEPIEGNDYVISFVEPLDEDFDEDTPILIQYGEGSEAEVFLHEISLFDEGQTYTVTLTFEGIDAKDPLSATKQVLKWIQDGADKMIYDVENELTGDKFTVDLSEEDEDAVVPNNE